MFHFLGEGYIQKLFLDILATCLLMYGIYLPNNHRNREHLFTFIMFNIVIFHIALTLNQVEISLGAAFGLFAVFGLMRYRTEDIPMKEMTYLFLAIALALIGAISTRVMDSIVINAVLLGGAYLLDGGLSARRELHKDIHYEKIELIKPDQRAALIHDIELRTGLKTHFVVVKSIDLVRDTANLRVFYYDESR